MEAAWVPWLSSLILLLITGVLLCTKMLKQTEAIGFAVIKFIIDGISILPPLLATSKVLNKLMQLKRITNADRRKITFVIFRKIAFSTPFRSHFTHFWTWLKKHC